MCAIVGSFDRDKLKELIELNSYRGNHSYSLSEYDITTNNITIVDKDFGEFNYGLIDNLTEGNYYIAHTQAPTTSAKNKECIHPSQFLNSYLWHNGIIKEDCIRMMNKELGTNEDWDTKLLHVWENSYGKKLDDIDGTFSCLMTHGTQVTLFRNEISPMFIDDELNISSTKFQNSYPTPPGEMLLINFKNKKLTKCFEFKTKENPYYFE